MSFDFDRNWLTPGADLFWTSHASFHQKAFSEIRTMTAAPRRLKLTHLPDSQLVALLSGRVRLVAPLVPSDLVVVSVHDEFWRGCLGVVLASDTFEAVPVGEPIPEWDGVEWRAVPAAMVMPLWSVTA